MASVLNTILYTIFHANKNNRHNYFIKNAHKNKDLLDNLA